jgi:hypothetical protein
MERVVSLSRGGGDGWVVGKRVDGWSSFFEWLESPPSNRLGSR